MRDVKTESLACFALMLQQNLKPGFMLPWLLDLWDDFSLFCPHQSVEGVWKQELLFAQGDFRGGTGNGWAKFSEASVEKVAEYGNLDESLSFYSLLLFLFGV